MRSIDKKLIYSTVTLMCLSGISIFIISDYMQIETKYGLMANPILDEVKLVHNFVTVFFFLILGKILDSHILKGIKSKNKKHRKTGLMIVSAIIVLFLSSPFLFYITNESALPIIKNIHLIAGLIFTASFLAHLYLVKKRK